MAASWLAAAVRWHGVLVRFGEVGIKSAPVRRQMLERLRGNLDAALLRAGVEGGAVRAGSRLWVRGPEPERLAEVARRAFGVVSVSPALQVDSQMGALVSAAVAAALAESWQSFAVRARREGEHPFTSRDIAVQVGSRVLEAAQATGRVARVDLDEPDLELHVEVRDARAYVYTRVLEGPGGLPLGSQGRVAVLLSDTASALAAWSMMRRGCDVVPVHAGDVGSVPLELVDVLASWGMTREVEVLPVCGGAVPKAALLEAAAAVARERRAIALVTGDTLRSRLVADPAGMPVLRPVCGLVEEEAARWRGFAGLPDVEGVAVVDEAGRETAASLLRLRRRVRA